MPPNRRKAAAALGRRFVAGVLIALSGVSCLPGDTRPPAGSILLEVSSADEPAVITADGWSISFERLLLGMGDASLGHDCTHYSEARYVRLLDGRLPTDQKLVLLFGLGPCDFQFGVGWPSPDALLGEGVTEADLAAMAANDPPLPGRPGDGIAVDLAGTATRNTEIKRFHWRFRQATSYRNCVRTVNGVRTRPIQLGSDENLTQHIGVRGAALFADDWNARTAELRFDPFAAADAMFGGNADDDVTLDELGKVPLSALQNADHPYGSGTNAFGTPHMLEDYLYLVLLSQLVALREDENIGCEAQLGFAPD